MICVNNRWSMILDIENSDKNKCEKIKYNLIEQNKYPKEIKTYLSVGKSYFDVVSETTKIEWDVENSVINYNIGHVNVISNIIQYTVLSTILTTSKSSNCSINKQQLIEYLVTKDVNVMSDAKKYLESYVSYLISKDIIVLSNGKLHINTAFNDIEQIESLFNTSLIDITEFKPSLTADATNSVHTNIQQITTETEVVKTDKNEMTNECLSYLRIMMLIKMFKTNSTTVFALNTILNRLSEHISKYVSSAKLNPSLQAVFNGLINVTDNQLIMELKSLEKRDIIEETKKGSTHGYIYVV